MNDLASLAQRLHHAAATRQAHRTSVYVARGYRTRRDELQPLVLRAGGCQKCMRLLREADLSLTLPVRKLATAAHKLRQVQSSFAKEPESITSPGVLEAHFVSQLLKECEDALNTAWLVFVSPPAENDPLVGVLQRYPPLKKAAARLANIRLELGSAAATLPKTRADISRVRKLHEQQQDQLSQLEGAGLNQVVLGFLNRCSLGVPLREVIENPELLNWIQENGLLDYFSIRG